MPAGDWSVQKFARRLMRLERDFKTLSTVPRLGNSSVDGGGAIKVNDPVTGIPVVVIGSQDDGSVMVNHVTGPPPPIPSAPIVTTDTPGYLTVEWDSGFVGKNLLPETADIGDLGIPYGGVANQDLETIAPSLLPSYKVTTVGGEPGPGFSWLVHGETLDPLETYTASAKFIIPRHWRHGLGHHRSSGPRAAS